MTVSIRPNAYQYGGNQIRGQRMKILALTILVIGMWVLGYIMGKVELIARFDYYYGKLNDDDLVIVKHLRQILKGDF